MPQISIFELLQQDIEDIKGLITYQNDGITKEVMKNQARGIILNVKEHIEELVEE